MEIRGRIIETHDKKWAIKQMLDGKKVKLNTWTGERYIVYHDGEFKQYGTPTSIDTRLYYIELAINSMPDNGYVLYEEPEKFELPEILELEGNRDQTTIKNRDLINQIIKYLKAKENN